MRPQRPGAVTGAIWLLVGVVAMTGVTALLTAVFHDELVDDWAEGRTDVGSVEPPAFVPVAITLFVVVALLAFVLLMFFREGHNWARLLLSALVAVLVVGTLASLRTGPPPVFVVAALLSIAVDVAAFVMLWHKDTRAFVDDDFWADSHRR
jgi:drug/metabolite transporter (DMT)-like permease